MMNLQQLTNERFLSDIKSLNKTIEAQAAEIARLNAQIERMADRMATMGSELVKADDEVAKLRALLERWHNESKYISDCFAGQHWDSEKLIRIKADTNEALK